MYPNDDIIYSRLSKFTEYSCVLENLETATMATLAALLRAVNSQ